MMHAGDCFTVTGISGSGKTMLLRHLADLAEFEGELFLDQRPCSSYDAPAWRRQVALLPTDSAWWEHSVEAHFPAGCNHEQLALLDLSSDILSKAPEDISSGEKQRLALLRLLQNRPQVLLLDEVTANLDQENKQRVEKLLQHYLRENQTCAIWITHDQEQIQRMSTRHYQLQDGQLVKAVTA